MNKLMEAGLFGGGLTPVDTPVLASRYNAALEQLGIGPTLLEKFHIDGIGWSPEIAQEKGDNFYLCAGIANPMGVIISPNQRKKPVYIPYNSYDRPMLEAYFERHNGSIADITSTSYVGLDIDQELTTYESPMDLLLVTYVTLRSVAGGLFDAAMRQKELVEQFKKEELSWLDRKLVGELKENSARWGDLRHRRIDIPPFPFNVGSFYTRAFGGVWLLRSGKSKKQMLVLPDNAHLAQCKRPGVEVFARGDLGLPEYLWREQLVEINPRWYKDHPDVLQDKKETMLARVIGEHDPEVNLADLKAAQKRQWARKLADHLPPAFRTIEILHKQLECGESPNIEHIDSALKLILYRPHRRLDTSEQEVMWMLLCRLQRGFDILRTYESDKNYFFSEYNSWPDSMKDWAINLIRERYVPRMNS